MADVVFKYPGGKTQLANWIHDHLKDHHTYVEVFGGSGVVLANKPKSEVEVYNDQDGDLVHFFETLRDHGDELAEWLSKTPHSRELHQKYRANFYDGDKPSDDIERAGQFFYLRFTQFASAYDSKSGYNGAATTCSGPNSYRQAIDRLTRWQDRFKHVQIEQLDYSELINRYDTEDTLFYCDPPYMDEGDDLYSHDGGFDHGRFVDALLETEGDWLVSYTRVPSPLQTAAECVVSQERLVRMDQGQHLEKTNTERLVMSYDPRECRGFAGVKQSGLESFQ
jgi:DNA adenine methylase